ncbi:hypothetical protein BH20CHL4_BH20CHL4_12110 [soil metagenome]
MMNNSRMVIRILLLLLFAVVGHEVLMIGAHASSHIEPAARPATRGTHHDRAGESGTSSGAAIRHGDNDNCVPGHDFVRRVDEAPSVQNQADTVMRLPTLSAAALALRFAHDEFPGRPPDQNRALLQVFLN